MLKSLVAALLASPLPVSAAPMPIAPMPALPLVSMSVADSAATPHPGDRVAYTVTVSNRDRLPLSLTVRLVIPEMLDNVTVLDGGQRADRAVTWPANLAPQQRAAVRFSGVPLTDGHLAVTACAYIDGSARPTACASDVDSVALPPPATGPQIARRLALAFGALLALTLAWRWWRRRRGVRPAHVAEVIAAARADHGEIRAAELADLAERARTVPAARERRARERKAASARTQLLPIVEGPAAGSAARGPAADSARAAVESGQPLTLTQDHAPTTPMR